MSREPYPAAAHAALAAIAQLEKRLQAEQMLVDERAAAAAAAQAMQAKVGGRPSVRDLIADACQALGPKATAKDIMRFLAANGLQVSERTVKRHRR